MKLNVVQLAQAKDFKRAVLDGIGDIIAKPSEEGGVDVLGEQVLVATYIEPEMTSGGIIRPENSVHMARFQGKVGLVLKMGEAAFTLDGSYEWQGKKAKVGDYIMYRASDGANELGFRGFSLKLINSQLIRMIIGNPADIY